MENKKAHAVADQKERKHRIITMLNRQEVDFLDTLEKDAFFTSGFRLTYNDILRTLVDLAMEQGLSAEKVNSLKKLKAKMLNVMRQELKAESGPDPGINNSS
ncbi:MAG: hypothetical protein KKC84_06695 [Candidatus Omnitrophica bacterium]|nr:hypothetical protein [Candidatus Omnitrophota bacterium]